MFGRHRWRHAHLPRTGRKTAQMGGMGKNLHSGNTIKHGYFSL
jgi:hypothetical protein